MIQCSPGLLQGCFDLLGILNRNELTAPQLKASFAKFGGLQTSKVLETAQALRWVAVELDGVLRLTPSGEQLKEISGYEPMLRRALLDYIEVERPAWLQNASFGRSRVLSFVNSEIGQVFVEADLTHGTDEPVVAFWDALAARARGQRNESLTKIGREGERLTIAHETRRTGRAPKWVAVDSNADGYDVLSIVGNGDATLLSIEVKATTRGLGGALHLTRNEWEWASDAVSHAFHLWSIDDGGEHALAVIPLEEMLEHVPKNLGAGSWEVVEIPFLAFKARFSVPSIHPSALA